MRRPDGLHHLLDARTGRPVHDVLATWVVADTAADADGLWLAGCTSTTDSTSDTAPPSASDSGTGPRATAGYADGDYDANVSRVAGASGCSEGFNAALEEIRADAAR